MGRKRKYSDEFRTDALRRMAESSNITALAAELGIRRKWLYAWRAAAQTKSQTAVRPRPAPTRPPAKAPTEPDQAAPWKELVAELTRENRFFAAALRRIEAKRPPSDEPTNAPSGPKFKARANRSKTPGKAD